MTQIVGALDEHRSRLYGEKTRRHLQAAREQGLPARPRVPFGLAKVRDDAGRFVAIEIHPTEGPMARKWIQLYIDGMSLSALRRRVFEDTQKDHQMGQLSQWLRNPMLTGRLCWHKDQRGVFKHVEAEPSFPALITDAEAALVRSRLEASSTAAGLRGRPPRMFSGLVRCADCGSSLASKTSGRATFYLRCSNALCKRHHKTIREDKVSGVLQFALRQHAPAILPVLTRPRTDPPEVARLEMEIQTLQGIGGTDEVVAAKRREITALRAGDSDTPGWLLVAAMRSQSFWLQDDPAINRQLRLILERVEVKLGATVAESVVSLVRCKTDPADAPLPPDQEKILLPVTDADLAVAATHQHRIDEVLAALAG